MYDSLTAQKGELDTPLHEAVHNCHVNVVKLLAEEDPDFSCPANSAETPLYMASKKGYDDLVSFILETCASPAYSGPHIAYSELLLRAFYEKNNLSDLPAKNFHKTPAVNTINNLLEPGTLLDFSVLPKK
ncbi:hypothetical protein RJ639_012002 [Escallonia herrerae]|uniref:Uncharacterized protein n=1 Tax=Escallonia herrerae TaxID=1293975 RepID=A0AA88VKU6_9ASTE|nr:hypothetical protein RJ639_012002 [Escallonia herrerae]